MSPRKKNARAARPKKPAKVAMKKVEPAVRQSSGSTLVRDVDVPTLVRDLGALIDDARKGVAVTANAALTTLYWQIGRRIRTEVLDGMRAEYGAQIVAALGRQLAARHGRGFDEKSLRRMIQFAEAFPDAEIVAALRRQLTWGHFKLLIPVRDQLKRAFYAEMSRVEGWSTRDLGERIDSMLYERTALSKKPEALIRQELSTLHEKGELSPAAAAPTAGARADPATEGTAPSGRSRRA